MRPLAAAALVLALATLGATAPKRTPDPVAVVAQGRLLVTYGACNDCHTPGWIESDGTLPATKWLTGNGIGFRGPWGTVYPANVRRRFTEVTEAQWIAMVRTRAGHPPMTWHDLRVLPDADLRAIYRFVRSLGVAGGDPPRSVPPDVAPKTPYYDVRPVTPKR